jgi:phage FluMu protein Com
MNNPLLCWNCNKLFGDVIQGAVNMEASTDLKEPVKETQIEIKCPRCKKMNSIIV